MDDIDLDVQLNGLELLEQIEEDAEIVLEKSDYINPFENLSDRQFIVLYRLSKDLATHVIDLVTPYMKAPSRSSSLTIEQKVMTALRFFASGSYQMDIGVSRHASVSQPSVSRIIEEVTTALCNPDIFEKIVYFPRNFEELNGVRKGFYDKFNIPGIIGAIDCTHIAIVPPKTDDLIYPEHIYVNRKGYHSINTQLICDVNMKILNVSARYPGSSHDSHIWNTSNVKTLLTDLHAQGHQSYILLGDSGYALRSWMLTPFLDPRPGTPEANYNGTICKARSTIERCIGVLKMRFRCLLKHRTLHYAPNKASKIINSCVVLHNLCVVNRVPMIYEENDEEVDYGIFQQNNINNALNDNRGNPELTAGQRIRQQFVDQFFT